MRQLGAENERTRADVRSELVAEFEAAMAADRAEIREQKALLDTVRVQLCCGGVSCATGSCVTGSCISVSCASTFAPVVVVSVEKRCYWAQSERCLLVVVVASRIVMLLVSKFY